MSRVGAFNESVTPTIQHAVTHFLHHSAQVDTPPTATIHRQALHQFIHFLTTHTTIHPSTDLVSILSLDIFRDFLQFLQSAYSPETEHAYFRAMHAFALTITQPDSPDNLPEQLTALAKSTRRKKQQQQIELPTDTQIKAIRDYINQVSLPQSENSASAYSERLRILRDKALILTLLDTGLKPTELAAIRKFHLQDNTISLHAITLPLSPQTTQAINRYLSERTQLDSQQKNIAASTLPLFARHDKRAGAHILAISRWTVANILTFWANAAASPDTPDNPDCITPTTLRHHFVMSTLASTNDLNLTQQRARHKDKATTRKYLHRKPHHDTD